MGDRWFFSLTVLAALAMVALALVWPVGQGAPAHESFVAGLPR